MKYALRAMLLMTLATASACGGCSDTPTPGEVWATPTKPPPDGCAGCPELELGTLSHGIEVTFLQDPDVDDELVQWSGCINAYIDCVDADGELATCMEQGPCPQPCKDAYAERVAGTDDYDTHAGAIEAIFMNDGGLCTPDTVPEAVIEAPEFTP